MASPFLADYVVSPRWYDPQSGEYLALDTGGGALARLWTTALAGLVDIGYIKATGLRSP